MLNVKKNSFLYDFLWVLVLGVILSFFIYTEKISFVFDIENFSGILIGLFGTLLGFVLTAFTILFMFDTDKNPTLNKIKKAGLFNQIHERFITTIAATFIALAYSIFYLIFTKFHDSLIIMEIILLFFTLLVFVRVYRSLKILYLIYKTIN